MRMGFSELLVIIIVAFALIKPEMLGEYAKAAGKAMRSLTEKAKEVNKEIVEPVKEAVEPVTSIQKELNQSINEISTAWKGEN